MRANYRNRAFQGAGAGAGGSWGAIRLLEAAKEWWRLRRQEEDPRSG